MQDKILFLTLGCTIGTVMTYVILSSIIYNKDDKLSVEDNGGTGCEKTEDP